MQQLVLEGLVTKPQRETAGSKTAVKLDYQQHWALARMIDLHLAGKDYLVAFEYHEDVLFMEPSDNPTSLDFAQVKTKEAGKPYRISDFVRPKKSKEHGELPSVMSKLISSLSGTVKAKSTRLLLVSNTRFSFETPSGIICATEIPIKEKKRIEDALAKHHPELNSKVIEKLFFHFTDMPLETAETYLRGKMVDLITSIFEKDTGISVTDLLQAIQGEIRRKNGYDSEKVKTVEDLKKHKCVSREYIEASMTRMVRAHSKVPNLDFMLSQLEKSGWSFDHIYKLRKQAAVAFSDRLDIYNTEVQHLWKAAESFYAKSHVNQDLDRYLDLGYTELEQSQKISPIYKERFYIQGVLILTYHEKH